MTRAPSQNERILALLSDRQPHRVPDIHRAVGTCRLNSRVAELRKRLRREGQTIVCRHLSGTGAEAYEYQIVPLDKPDAGADKGAVASAVSGSVRTPSGLSSGATSSDPSGNAAAITAAAPLVQLTLEVAA